MANNNTGMILVILAVVAIGVYFLLGGGSTDVIQPEQPTMDICALEDISFSPNMVREGKAGTSLSTSANNYFILTNGMGDNEADTAKTVAVNKDLEILFGENSSTYYTVYEKFNTGCEDPLEMLIKLPMADTSLSSFYAKNSDGMVNSDSDEEGMDADDEWETTITMKASTNEYFGNPTSDCRNIAVIQYDKTYFKIAEGAENAPVPSSHSFFNSTYDGRNAIYIPKVGNGEEATFNVRLESTSSAPTAASANPKITILDCDFDKDEDTLRVISGVEDEDYNSISLASQTIDLYVE